MYDSMPLEVRRRHALRLIPVQLILSCICFILSTVTTGLNDNYSNRFQAFSAGSSLEHVQRYASGFADGYGIGILVGFLGTFGALAGIIGWRKDVESLCVVHLCSSILSLIILIPLVLTLAITLNGLKSCWSSGIMLRLESEDQLPPGSLYLYEEELQCELDMYHAAASSMCRNMTCASCTWKFSCTSASFTIWLAMDSIILVSAICQYVIGIVLVVLIGKEVCSSDHCYSCYYCCTCYPRKKDQYQSEPVQVVFHPTSYPDYSVSQGRIGRVIYMSSYVMTADDEYISERRSHHYIQPEEGGDKVITHM